MQELFKKYLDNECSRAELKELLEAFNIPENELQLRELIAESLEKKNIEEDEIEWTAAIEETFVAIKKQQRAERGKVVPVSVIRRPWLILAAASVLLFGGFAIYKFFKDAGNQANDVAGADGSKKEIGPGSNKAI